MARKPDGLTAKTVTGSYRWSPSTNAAFDRIRGKTPRSTYLERLVLQEERRQKENPRGKAPE